MEKAEFVGLQMGVILCKYCCKTMGTVDSEKVTTYYSSCSEPECLETRDRIDHEALEC